MLHNSKRLDITYFAYITRIRIYNIHIMCMTLKYVKCRFLQVHFKHLEFLGSLKKAIHKKEEGT